MAPLGSLEETWLADHEPMICVLLLKMGILDCHVSLLEGSSGKTWDSWWWWWWWTVVALL